MSLQEFLRMENEACAILAHKDPVMFWRAIECGAVDKARLFAESRDYAVSLDQLLQVMFFEVCLNMPYQNTAQCIE